MKTALGLIAGMVVSVSGMALHAQQDYPISIPVPAGSPPPVYKRCETLARDDVKLVIHEWTPARASAGKPVALFLHGIGMHGEPYRAIAAAFTSRSIPFVVPDLRGHGRSEGTRGELARPDVLRADIGAIIAWIHERYPGAPVVLLGDSMGGVIAVDYAWRGEQRLAGLGLIVPALGLNKAQWEKPGGDLKNLLTRGRLVLGSESKLKPSTQSPGFLQARIEDKLALREVELSYLLTIHEMQREWLRAAAAIKVPLFICVTEKDHIIDNAVVRRFFDRTATAKKDKTWRDVEGAYHTVCWDPATPALMDELTGWILKISK